MANPNVPPVVAQNPAPVINANRAFGGLDNANYWSNSLAGDQFIRQLYFTRLNIAPFRGDEWTFKPIPTIVFLGSLGRYLYSADNGARPSVSTLYTVTLGEVLTPCLDANYILPMIRSRTTLVSSVKALMISDVLGAYTTATRATYLQECRVLADRDDDPGSVYIQLGAIAAGMMAPNEAWWPDTNGGIMALQLTPDQAMSILFYLSTQAISRIVKTGVDCIAHIIVAIVKRGNVTTQFLTKIEQGLQLDLNRVITLDEETIRLVYLYYGALIDDTNIGDVFTRWAGQIPVNALRLRLTVEQASGSGMTAYFSIKEAITDYQDFNWAKISLFLPLDWAHFVRAVNLVGDNPYYGYRKDLGEARSTLYKNLAWVGKELLIRVGAKASLSRYLGWPRAIPHQQAISEMINEYVDGRAEAVTDEDADVVREQPNFIAQIAIITGQQAAPL